MVGDDYADAIANNAERGQGALDAGSYGHLKPGLPQDCFADDELHWVVVNEEDLVQKFTLLLSPAAPSGCEVARDGAYTVIHATKKRGYTNKMLRQGSALYALTEYSRPECNATTVSREVRAFPARRDAIFERTWSPADARPRSGPPKPKNDCRLPQGPKRYAADRRSLPSLVTSPARENRPCLRVASTAHRRERGSSPRQPARLETHERIRATSSSRVAPPECHSRSQAEYHSRPRATSSSRVAPPECHSRSQAGY